jgi:hypothetical protein
VSPQKIVCTYLWSLSGSLRTILPSLQSLSNIEKGAQKGESCSWLLLRKVMAHYRKNIIFEVGQISIRKMMGLIPIHWALAINLFAESQFPHL